MRIPIRLRLAFVSSLIGFSILVTARSAGSTSAIFTDTEGIHLKFQAGFWGCTYSKGYWRSHPDEWPLTEVTLGSDTYDQTQLIEILITPSKADATVILVHQLVAAKLNIANGADSEVIQESIDSADAWLNEHLLGSDPQGESRDTGIRLSDSLESFNAGEIGPGACEDDVHEEDDEARVASRPPSN